LLAFALLGEMALNALGISLAALRAAGGVLLIGIDLVTVKGSGATTTTSDEDREAEERSLILPISSGYAAVDGPWCDWCGDSINGSC
jgi:multiple antibiotic resistance protein